MIILKFPPLGQCGPNWNKQQQLKPNSLQKQIQLFHGEVSDMEKADTVLFKFILLP